MKKAILSLVIFSLIGLYGCSNQNQADIQQGGKQIKEQTSNQGVGDQILNEKDKDSSQENNTDKNSQKSDKTSNNPDTSNNQNHKDSAKQKNKNNSLSNFTTTGFVFIKNNEGESDYYDIRNSLLFYTGKNIKGADIDSFVYYENDSQIAKDINNFYISGSQINSGDIIDKFGINIEPQNTYFSGNLDNLYIFSGNNVYYSGKNIQTTSFKDLEIFSQNYSYAKDNKNIFYKGQILSGASVDKFEILGAGYSRDGENIYYKDKIQSDRSINDCFWNDGLIDANKHINLYLTDKVPYSRSCENISREFKCEKGEIVDPNGELDKEDIKSFEYKNCKIKEPKNCKLDGKTIKHGESITMYKDSKVPYEKECKKENRKCNNGELEGDYQYKKCSHYAEFYENLEGDYYAISDNSTEYPNGCNSKGLTNPRENCILYINDLDRYIAPTSTEQLKMHWDGQADVYPDDQESIKSITKKGTIGYGDAWDQCARMDIDNKEWYLPDVDELKSIYKTKDKIKGLQEKLYWSSSLYDNQYLASIRWIALDTGNNKTVGKWRENELRIRCMAK